MADSVQKPLLRGPVRVGFYDIERTLGKGNFAVVKLARHRITKTEVSSRVNLLAWKANLGCCSAELYNFYALVDTPATIEALIQTRVMQLPVDT